MKTVGITIVSHDSYDDVLVFFSSFLNYNSPEGVDFLVLETSENGRMNDLAKTIHGEISLRVVYISNNGYASACNYGLRYFCEHDIVILSNSDIVFTSTVMDSIRENFNRKNYGTILQKNPSGRIVTFDLYPQFKNVFTELLKIHRLLNKFKLYDQRYMYLVGAFMVFGNDVIQENGLFDENFFLYCEETDYYYRLRKNTNTLIIVNTCIIHSISSSIGKKFSTSKSRLLESSLDYYYDKHKYKPFLDYWKVSRKINTVYTSLLSLFAKETKEKVCL